MNKHKVFLILLVIFGNHILSAQVLELSSNTLVGTKGKLPFWLWANQLGRYDQQSDFIQNFQLDGKYETPLGKSAFSFQTGASLNLLLGNSNDFRFTELYGGFNWKPLQITAGTFADPELYDGLSSTNGNIAASRNARPHPKIRAGFNRFVNVLPGFFINGFYEEGILIDDRYVKDTHLHRKALYLRFGKPEKIQVTAGMEHFVMWYGTHPVYGKLQGWEAYWSYVLAQSGGKDALKPDQQNVMGNGYGSYQLEISKKLKTTVFTLYLSHPFRDKSGVEWENYPDNLYGLFITQDKEKALIKSLLIEYFYTQNQSGREHLVPQPDGTLSGRGQDNYFNHGIYQSAATYFGMATASPIFGPVVWKDGTPMGYESTRFKGFHFGARGYLCESLDWKGLLTYSRHLGRYKGTNENTYDPPRKQGAALIGVNWAPQKLPLVFGASLTLDHGSLYDEGNSTTRIGTMLSAKWQIAK